MRDTHRLGGRELGKRGQMWRTLAKLGSLCPVNQAEVWQRKVCVVFSARSLALAPWGASAEQQQTGLIFPGRLLRFSNEHGRKRHQVPHASETFCLKLLPQGFLHVLYLLRDHCVAEVVSKLLFQQHPDDLDAAFIHHGLRLSESIASPPRDGVALDVVGREELVEQRLAGSADFLVKPDGLFELFLGVAVEELHHLTWLPVGLLLEGQGFQPLHLLLQREDILMEIQYHPLQLLYLLRPEKLKLHVQRQDDTMASLQTLLRIEHLHPSSDNMPPASRDRTTSPPECRLTQLDLSEEWGRREE